MTSTTHSGWINCDKHPQSRSGTAIHSHFSYKHPDFQDSKGDRRVQARLGMVVFWVLALQRNQGEQSPLLTYGVCDRTRDALSLP